MEHMQLQKNDFLFSTPRWCKELFQGINLLNYFKIKSNLSLYLLYYAEACNEFAGPISASLRQRATQLLSKKCCSCSESLATLCPI